MVYHRAGNGMRDKFGMFIPCLRKRTMRRDKYGLESYPHVGGPRKFIRTGVNAACSTRKDG